MEFDIDDALIHAITSDEYAATRGDVVASGPLVALAASQPRHDARLAAAADAETLACKAGCFWCCYFTIDVRPAEVLRIVDFVAANLAKEEQQRVRSEVAANSASLSLLDADERVRQNLKCPFLVSGQCSIYTARPQTCRNYHATNVAGCQQTFEEPDNEDIDPEFAPLVYQSGAAHVDAHSRAMSEAGYDVSAYEMNMALAATFADPEMVRRRYAAKQSAFPELTGIDVPMQFMAED
jgi:Fe-S-cluster containining protein